MPADVLILLVLVLVAAGAFALESLGPDWARAVALGFGLLLVASIVVGMVFRIRAKRRRAPADGPGRPGPTQPE